MVPARAKISRKRWANLRSDLAAAIEASGLLPMLKTADLDLDEVWTRLLAAADPRIRHGLSRFARWASLRRIAPETVDDEHDRPLRRRTRCGDPDQESWLPAPHSREDVERPCAAPSGRWSAAGCGAKQQACTDPDSLAAAPSLVPGGCRAYLTWAAVPDPLADGARARALAPLSLRLQQTHIHSAVTAAAAAGIPRRSVTSLASLVEPETFRTLLRHRWRQDGSKLSAYTHGVASR